MSEIEVLMFDADGVLIPPWRFARYLREEAGIGQRDTEQFFSGVFQNCLVGEADLKEVLPPYLEQWGWSDGVDLFVETWLKEEDLLDEKLLAFIQDLRKRGFICALASNQELYRSRYMLEVMGLEDHFDYLFFSAFMGSKKPEKEYFEETVCTLRCQAKNILFFDDSPTIVKAARRFGLCAEVYRDTSEFEQQLLPYIELK